MLICSWKPRSEYRMDQRVHLVILTSHLIEKDIFSGRCKVSYSESVPVAYRCGSKTGALQNQDPFTLYQAASILSLKILINNLPSGDQSSFLNPDQWLQVICSLQVMWHQIIFSFIEHHFQVVWYVPEVIILPSVLVHAGQQVCRSFLLLWLSWTSCQGQVNMLKWQSRLGRGIPQGPSATSPVPFWKPVVV